MDGSKVGNFVLASYYGTRKDVEKYRRSMYGEGSQN